MAFNHQGMREHIASEVTQTEPSPEWKAQEEKAGGEGGAAGMQRCDEPDKTIEDYRDV